MRPESHILAAAEDGGTVWRARCGMAINRSQWNTFFVFDSRTCRCPRCVAAEEALPVAMILQDATRRFPCRVDAFRALKALGRPSALVMVDDGSDDARFAERISAYRAAVKDISGRRDARWKSARLHGTPRNKRSAIMLHWQSEVMAARCEAGLLRDYAAKPDRRMAERFLHQVALGRDQQDDEGEEIDADHAE